MYFIPIKKLYIDLFLIENIHINMYRVQLQVYNEYVIYYRAKKEDGESDTELESVYEEETEDLFTVRADDMPLMNSTMISSVSMTSDPNALGKINALQDELSSLRQQIAMLVINQEQINKSQCWFHSKPNFLEFLDTILF